MQPFEIDRPTTRSGILRRYMGVRCTWGLACVLVLGCGEAADDLFCDGEGCAARGGDWARIASLANLPERPPADVSNRYGDDDAAVALGRRFYFDTAFSGLSRGADSLRRPTTAVRAPVCQPI